MNSLYAPSRAAVSHSLPIQTLLLIDSGYSHTHVIPQYQGRLIHTAIRRLEIGGKFLTNYLKDIVSLRHYNMLDESYIMNEVKEAVCYVSSDFSSDLEKTWKGGVGDQKREKDLSVVVDYVLPDYNTHKQGFMRPHDPTLSAKVRKATSAGGGTTEDFMTLGNERFTVPELLFSPSDVGMKQAGIAQMVMQSLQSIPKSLWGPMLANIVVVGGSAKIPGFIERLEQEIRQYIPMEYPCRVVKPGE
jgi:actin-related protein 6